MSTPTKITASGVPFVPEGRETEKPSNQKRMAALFGRYCTLTDKQAVHFSSHLFGALESMSVYWYSEPTPDRIVDAVERAIVSAEANK